ncbi:MAG: hypothetical protein KF788_06475 [Piscinibacter sp.]|nr:hypothetical protein [Piscinibacter sp.]
MTIVALPLDDETFLAAVTGCRLPASEFGHLQHLRLGWLRLRQAPPDAAIERTCADIARFAAHHGADGKFHRTVTEALLRLMAHGGAAEPALDWPGFLQRNPALRDDARGLLARHYSPTLLASPEARRRFLPPDLLPLPLPPPLPTFLPA